jgi:hypothetical protein
MRFYRYLAAPFDLQHIYDVYDLLEMPMNHVETLLRVNNSVSFIFNILILTVPSY